MEFREQVALNFSLLATYHYNLLDFFSRSNLEQL